MLPVSELLMFAERSIAGGDGGGSSFASRLTGTLFL